MTDTRHLEIQVKSGPVCHPHKESPEEDQAKAVDLSTFLTSEERDAVFFALKDRWSQERDVQALNALSKLLRLLYPAPKS